jgi:hypothetical protein
VIRRHACAGAAGGFIVGVGIAQTFATWGGWVGGTGAAFIGAWLLNTVFWLVMAVPVGCGAAAFGAWAAIRLPWTSVRPSALIGAWRCGVDGSDLLAAAVAGRHMMASATGTRLALLRVIVWLNGTHGVGKTTTGALVQQLIPDSRVFDAEKVGEMLMDITPGLPETDNFQHWPPWRPLVVETARRILDYTGGTLVIPMTVLVEPYWREISTGLAHHAIPVRHFVLHADQPALRARIGGDMLLGPDSPFRLAYLEPYAQASRDWLHREAEVIDTTRLTPDGAARRIADAVRG